MGVHMAEWEVVLVISLQAHVRCYVGIKNLTSSSSQHDKLQHMIEY